MANQIYSMDWNDTFLNEDHLRASFPGYRVQVELKTPRMKPHPPFRLEFDKPHGEEQQHKAGQEVQEEKMETEPVIKVEPHVTPKQRSVSLQSTEKECGAIHTNPGGSYQSGHAGT